MKWKYVNGFTILKVCVCVCVCAPTHVSHPEGVGSTALMPDGRVSTGVATLSEPPPPAAALRASLSGSGSCPHTAVLKSCTH